MYKWQKLFQICVVYYLSHLLSAPTMYGYQVTRNKGFKYKLLPKFQFSGHEICTIPSVYHVYDCIQLCTKQTHCVSFTFSKSDKACNLKNGTSSMFPGDMVPTLQIGNLYYESTMPRPPVSSDDQALCIQDDIALHWMHQPCYIDVCATAANNCDANAQCSNTVEGFTCRPTCNSGYKGNGTTCSDIDECATGANLSNCDANALCSNTVGSFTCTCNSGYDGDGTTCTDIDECETGADDCDANAQCSNTIGGFTCDCNLGYGGNGTTCTVLCEEELGTTTDPAISCAYLMEDCEKTSGMYYLRAEGQTSYQVFCDMETFGGGWARFGKGNMGSVWNYQDEDEVTTTIDTISTSDLLKIQNMHFTKFRISADVDLWLQADDSFNPSWLRFVPLLPTGPDFTSEGEMEIIGRADHTHLVFDTEGDRDRIECSRGAVTKTKCGTGSLPPPGTTSERLVILSAFFGPRASGASAHDNGWWRNRYTWKGSYYYVLAK